MATTPAKLDPELQKIAEGRQHDPFAVLGRHTKGKDAVVRVYMPHVTEVTLAEGGLRWRGSRAAISSSGVVPPARCRSATG